MSIFAVGINHESAPVKIRERIAIAPEATVDALHNLTQLPGVSEAAILSTCNRTELYCCTEPMAENAPAAWLHHYHELDTGKLNQFLYSHRDDQAVRHMLRVATGLDSMVLGEPEILGQMKSAYRLARSAETLGAPLERLFQHTFSVAKRVRTDTAIGENPVSVAFTAVTLAKRVFGDLSRQNVLFVGAGETIELAARHLVSNKVAHVMVANRTLSKAQDLANRIGGSAIPLHAIDDHLAKADLLLCSTGAREPIIHLDAVKAAIVKRKRRPMFMVDLAVPRDVAEEVGELSDVYLYTIDDLKEAAEAGKAGRKQAALEAESMVDLQVEDFMRWLRSLSAVASIREYRDRAMTARDELVEQAVRQLAAGKSVEDTLNALANRLTQRFLHTPSLRMRQAAAHGRDDLLEAARELFALADEDKDSK
jgi:glutamyl-tRNA reductase